MIESSAVKNTLLKAPGSVPGNPHGCSHSSVTQGTGDHGPSSCFLGDPGTQVVHRHICIPNRSTQKIKLKHIKRLETQLSC